MTHCYGCNARASGRVLRDSGDVILRCEFRDVVICIQQVDHDVCCCAEALGSVDLHRQQLREDKYKVIELVLKALVYL